MEPRDEETIRASVEARDPAPEPQLCWISAGGRRRRLPLQGCFLENGYLRVARALLGLAKGDVLRRAQQELAAWQEREVRERVADAERDVAYRAIQDTELAEAEIETVRRSLGASLPVDPALPSMDTLLAIPDFVECELDWCEPTPVRPEKRLIEHVLRAVYTRRLLAYERAMQVRKEGKARALAEHAQAEASRRMAHEAAAASLRSDVEGFRHDHEAGEPAALVEWLGGVFERMVHPVRLAPRHRVHWLASEEAVLVDLDVPALEDVSQVAGYRAQERYMRVAPVMMKDAEHAALYDEGVAQLALRALLTVFEATPAGVPERAAVNLWTRFVDPDDETDTTVCLLSVRAERDEVLAWKRDEVDASDALADLGAELGAPSQREPVRPLLEVRHALDELRGNGVRDFEERVCAALRITFPGEDVELRVETSRGGEVEGLVIDRDPLRGGRFAVRARRTPEPVPVSALHELEASMRDLSASRGLFFASDRFAAEALAYGRGRPLVLVGGEDFACLTAGHDSGVVAG